MNKLWKMLIFCIFMLFTFIGSADAANAASLPPGFLVGDDTGLQAGADGEYFIVNNDIVPGTSFSRTITLSNYSKKDGDFSINLVMNPEDDEHVPETAGAVDLLEAVSVTLTYQGKKIYEGPINGEGVPIANQKKAPLSLGTLEIGEVRNIQAEFVVSDEYPKEAWQKVNSVDFYWLFYASREKTTPSTSEPGGSGPSTTQSSSSPSPIGKLPQTGEDWRYVLLGMIAGLVLITMALVVAKKKQSKG